MFVFVPTLTSLHLPLPVQRYAVIYTLFENLSHSSSLLFKEKDKGGGNTHTCIIESTVMVIYLYCKTCNTVYELLLDRCARSSFPVLLSSLMFSQNGFTETSGHQESEKGAIYSAERHATKIYAHGGASGV